MSAVVVCDCWSFDPQRWYDNPDDDVCGCGHVREEHSPDGPCAVREVLP